MYIFSLFFTFFHIFSLFFAFFRFFSLFSLFFIFFAFFHRSESCEIRLFFALKRNKIFASISNFASKAKVRAHPSFDLSSGIVRKKWARQLDEISFFANILILFAETERIGDDLRKVSHQNDQND
jgi:hypothetical protein